MSQPDQSASVPEVPQESAGTPYRDDPNESTEAGPSTDAVSSSQLDAEARTGSLLAITWISLVLSVVSFGMDVALRTIEKVTPKGLQFPWSLRTVLATMLYASIIIGVLDILNLVLWSRPQRRSAHMLLNLLVDGIAALFVVGATMANSDRILPECYRYYYPPDNEPDLTECRDWIKWLGPLASIFWAVSLVIGLLSTAKLVIRFVRMYKAHRVVGQGNRAQAAWRSWFPTGTVSLEINFRVLRQEPATNAPSPSATNPVQDPTGPSAPSSTTN